MDKKSSIERNELINAAIVQVFLILISITMLVPFIWMILTSFKTVTEATQVNPFVIFPKVWRTDAFKSVMENMNFILLYKNTLLMIVFRVLCAVVTATTAGYAFARLNFKGKNFAFSLVLFQMMVPSQIFLIPQYLMISKMNMLDTMFALVFPGLVTAFGTFLLKQAFMLPLAKSSMVALGIFTSLFAYKDLMWPMIVNKDKNLLVLSSALAQMQGQYVTKFPELMAASLIACVLMIIIFLIFQKQFIQGIATSGGKL